MKDKNMFKIAKKKRSGLCCAFRCLKASGKKDRFCPKHRHRYNKANNYLNYTYNLLRSNAISRNKEFALTLDQFKQFCADTDYLERKGKKGSSLTVERIDPLKGYEIGNIRALDHYSNSYKGSTQDKDAHSRSRCVDDDIPF